MPNEKIAHLERRVEQASTDFKTHLKELEAQVSQTVSVTSEQAAKYVENAISAINPIEQVRRNPWLGVSLATLAGGFFAYKLRGGQAAKATSEMPRKELRSEFGNLAPVRPSLLREMSRTLFISALSAAASQWGRTKLNGLLPVDSPPLQYAPDLQNTGAEAPPPPSEFLH